MKLKKSMLSILFIIVSFVFTLSACNTVNLKYDETGYTIGSANISENIDVKEIEVEWVNGNVTVKHGDSFSIKEIGNNITEDLTMRTKVIGDTLHIKYMKSGSISVKNFKKELEITLPSNFPIEELEIDVINGDITLSVLALKEIDLEATTGNITLTNVSANDISLKTVTGNIQAIQTTSDEFEADTTTGNVTITTLTTRKFDTDITTGNLTVADLYANEADIELTTGTALLGLSTKVTGFSLIQDVKSNRITINPSNTPYTIDNGIYNYGDKSMKIEVEIISGDLILSLV